MSAAATKHFCAEKVPQCIAMCTDNKIAETLTHVTFCAQTRYRQAEL